MKFPLLILLAATAGLAFGLLDFIFSWNPIAAAPYWTHHTEPAFRNPPALGLGFFAEAINGWVAAFAFILVEPALQGGWPRRGAQFGLILWGFWVLSGTLSVAVWLDIPTSLAVANIIFGLPKSMAIGICISGAWRKLSKLRM
ncbi:MAG: hypothetical protein HY921_12870 [Elusimicrobia bacterium]|nr:hypothetical protein [Elusimicrobiota bacterium]